MPAKNIINTALKTARKGEGDFRLAAVLFKGGSILRICVNSPKHIGYRRDLFEWEPTRHAELNALHNMPRDVLKECSILVVRLNYSDQIVSAKPCKACIQAIKAAGISKLYYTNYDGKIVRVNPNRVDVKNWEKEVASSEYLKSGRALATYIG